MKPNVLSRRQFLSLSLVSVGGAWLAASGLRPTLRTAAASATASAMQQAAAAFLAGLSANQLAESTFAFDDSERRNWHWIPGYSRKGIMLGSLNSDQKVLAQDLLRASLSEAGYKKLQDLLKLQVVRSRDPERYFVSIFGTPSTTEAWGWRFEGHHTSLHFTVKGDGIAMTPMFLGAAPTEVLSGEFKGLRAMPREEELARQLLLSLSERLRAQAVFSAATPGDVVTRNARTVEPLAPVGIPAGEFNEAQMALMMGIIEEYLGFVAPEIGRIQMARIRSAGFENIRFGWAGSAEPRQRHYYRLQGPTFLLDFDNSRESGTHIHSVWRDFTGDFGADLA